MGLLDRINAHLNRRNHAYPVGAAVVEPFDKAYGHRDETYSPEMYGDYLVTSNEVFSAAMLRARLVSSVPLRLYKGRAEDKRELPNSPAAELLRRVNPHWTWARLSRMDELCACLWGESMWAIERDSAGVPREIWWLKPSRMMPVPDESRYLAGWRYESNVNGQVIEFESDEVVWFRYPNPLDEYSALSPMAAARLAADTGAAMMKANYNLHKQGLQIAGMVTPKAQAGQVAQFTAPQADELQERLEKRFSGAEKAHRWAVLRFEAEFKPVNLSPKDAEFIGGLGLTLRQVANAFGIPAPLLNELEHATLANLREFQTGLWEHALVPDLQLRAQDIEEQFLPLFGGRGPDHAEFDFGRVPALQKANSEAWDRERQAVEVGALTVNEWRKRHGLPPVAWGDVWWAPVNKSAVTDAESTPQGNTTPTGDPAPDPDPDQLARSASRIRALDPPSGGPQ